MWFANSFWRLLPLEEKCNNIASKFSYTKNWTHHGWSDLYQADQSSFNLLDLTLFQKTSHSAFLFPFPLLNLPLTPFDPLLGRASFRASVLLPFVGMCAASYQSELPDSPSMVRSGGAWRRDVTWRDVTASLSLTRRDVTRRSLSTTAPHFLTWRDVTTSLSPVMSWRDVTWRDGLLVHGGACDVLTWRDVTWRPPCPRRRLWRPDVTWRDVTCPRQLLHLTWRDGL